MTQIKPPLVLASASPRRKALLESMGVVFSIAVTDIDESVRDGESPQAYVLRMAHEKAQSAENLFAIEGSENKAILAADTIVCKDDTVFGKPENREDAFRIWHQLSNSKHQVVTAIRLISNSHVDSKMCITEVEFAEISQTQMDRYWLSDEPHDKAGGYAIQGIAAAWVKQIHGSYSNVVGLPLYETNELLATIELNWM